MPTARRPAPDFTLPRDGGGSITLSDLRPKPVVLFFYPKDDTPGCTKEACGFRDLWRKIQKQDAVVLGVSPDGPEAHQKFAAKYKLPFTLLCDPTKKTMEKYGAWGEKSMYGKKYMGIDRSTFLVDADGTVAKVWRGVKVPGHAEAVLEAAKGLVQKAA